MVGVMGFEVEAGLGDKPSMRPGRYCICLSRVTSITAMSTATTGGIAIHRLHIALARSRKTQQDDSYLRR